MSRDASGSSAATSAAGPVLAGQRALVTGASRGIGAAVARTLATAGASVVVSARSRDAIEDLARELGEAGSQAWALPCDVADASQVDALAGAVAEACGGVDILVNNAGIATSAPFLRTSLETWNRLLAVNATGVFLCSQAFLPGMLEQGRGRIVNVASVAGKSGGPYISAYVASKHAVVGLTRALAAEVAAKGVTVNAVCPGFVDTEMTEESVRRIVGKTGVDPEEARRRLETMSPQNRMMSADEVAYQVLALCDPRAAGVNGQALVLDGGALQS